MERALGNLKAEIEQDMRLMGVSRVSELSRDGYAFDEPFRMTELGTAGERFEFNQRAWDRLVSLGIAGRSLSVVKRLQSEAAIGSWCLRPHFRCRRHGFHH